MVKFKAKNQDLTRFFEKCAAKGVVIITPSERTTRMFFSHFYVDVKKETETIEELNEETKETEKKEVEIHKLIVKAVDAGEKRMYIRHSLKGIEIEEEGRLGITDVNLILDVLKAIPKKREVSFLYDTESRFLFVETVDKGTYYGYRVRQANITEQDQTALANSVLNVDGWDRIHTFEKGLPKITIGEASSLYNTVIEFRNEELSKVISDSVNLTYDQNIRISLEDGKVKFRSGRESDGVKSETVIEKEIENPIKVDEKKLTNLHPIVDHLFGKSTFYCRIAGQDGALKFWIKSAEDNIELNFCSSSV